MPTCPSSTPVVCAVFTTLVSVHCTALHSFITTTHARTCAHTHTHTHTHTTLLPAHPNMHARARARTHTQDTPGGNVAARIAVLAEALLDLVFAYVSRSLFNADRLTFGMHMARHLLPPNAIKPEEWAFFLGAWCAGFVRIGRTVLRGFERGCSMWIHCSVWWWVRRGVLRRDRGTLHGRMECGAACVHTHTHTHCICVGMPAAGAAPGTAATKPTCNK